MSITAEIGILADVESKSTSKKVHLKTEQTMKDDLIDT